jgi:arabinogalactan oligomer / maltooligosaccharide transport system permease protein
MSAFEMAGQEKDTSSGSRLGLVVRVLLVVAVGAFAGVFAFRLWNIGVYYLAALIVFLAVLWGWVLLRNEAYPLRWMVVGLTMMAIFAIYPILFTVYIAFTNFGDGHLLTKEQAIMQLERQTFLPEGRDPYTWTLFITPDEQFALWLQSPDSTDSVFAIPDEELIYAEPGQDGFGDFDDNGIPLTIEGYQRLSRIQTLRYITTLETLRFGAEERIFQITSTEAASERLPRFAYDPDQDILLNQETGEVFEPIDGRFVGQVSGQRLIPGFRAPVGFDNFRRFWESPAMSGPLVRIITWNFAFAFLSVVSTFALGLAIAYIYNDPAFPGKKIIQSFLLIPYTIPSLITILIWRGLMNPQFGVINNFLSSTIGIAPAWFSNEWWAKVAILVVNLWLGYPYFMLICSGALQAIPQDIYQAAEVDGANAWQRFTNITLPLLLVAVGPLLIASFTFNFNNFNLIFLFIQGGPPIADSAVRAGHTDILISFVYNLAFAGGRGADYGLASAITIIIFIIVAVITLAQFRFTRMWEEVGENV